MSKYVIASEEGAQRYGGEEAGIGDTVELDLDPGEELAVICAGWLEEVKKTKEANT
jgi:hypothetical protein